MIMKRFVIVAFLLLPLLTMGQRLSKEQSGERIGQLQRLLQQYKPHYPREFEFHADCNLAVFTDSTDWQGIVALDGTVLLPPQYVVYRQIVDSCPTPYFLVLNKDKMGLLDKEMRWVLSMEDNHDFNDCLAGCYTPYLHHWLEENNARLEHPLDLDAYVKLSTLHSPLSTIDGPYEELHPVADDLFFFYTGNPGDRSDQIFGYVDIYGNTTATPSQLATMEKWKSGVIEYDVEPISVTDVVPFEDAKSRYAIVFTCLSDTHRVGYLLVPKEDSASLALFSSRVSEDLWGKPVGISTKRYAATLTDVQQAETLLAELMKDDILPCFGRWRRYIGNPDNYTKYGRTYGFYYNEQGERCVYIQMDLGSFLNRRQIAFSRMWDACDAVVFINLNLDTQQVIRAYASSCQSY